VAQNLNIKSLLDLVGKTFDGMLRGRSVAECSKTLNVLNVFARGEQDIRRRPHGLFAYLF
ncbi:SKP1-like protein 1A, partial [Tanacetum coccineum]